MNFKKYMFLFFFITNITFYSNAMKLNIVYIHLGPSVPVYIYDALEQARLFNPDIPIYFIAERRALLESSFNFEKKLIQTISCESLTISSLHKKFLSNSILHKGFWRYASERFFYLHEFIREHNLTNVIHIESDNLIYVSIKEISDALSRYKGIGAVFDSDNRCIPSFVFIKDIDAIEGLISFMTDHAREGHNDMAIIALYRKHTTKDNIDFLPLIMPDYLNHHSLINHMNQNPIKPDEYCNNFQLFRSIFDGAALGQYLGGIYGQPDRKGFINETCIFSPSHLTFEWIKDEQGRKIPYACFNNVRYRINNLHIHSKELEKFRS